MRTKKATEIEKDLRAKNRLQSQKQKTEHAKNRAEMENRDEKNRAKMEDRVQVHSFWTKTTGLGLNDAKEQWARKKRGSEA